MPDSLVDTSVWVAGTFLRHPHFGVAHAFLAAPTDAGARWLARAVENSFLRLLTTPALCRAYDAPVVTNSQAVDILARWCSQSNVRGLDQEPSGVRDLWLRFAATPTASPKIWMDSYLAALAIRAHLNFVTLDADFRRFEAAGLRLYLLGG